MPSPSSMCLYSTPPRSNNAGPLRYSTPPRSAAGMTPRTSQRSRSCSASSPRVSETDLYACDQSACEYTQYPNVAGSVSKGSSGGIAPRRSPQPSVFGVRGVRDVVVEFFVEAEDAEVARQTRAPRARGARARGWTPPSGIPAAGCDENMRSSRVPSPCTPQCRARRGARDVPRQCNIDKHPNSHDHRSPPRKGDVSQTKTGQPTPRSSHALPGARRSCHLPPARSRFRA